MALPLTENALSAIDQVIKEPNVVLEIDGVDTIFGALIIQIYALIGNDIIIGDPEVNPQAVYIGNLSELQGQDNAISLGDTTSSIRQMLNIDKGQAGSISNMSIALVDNGDITNLITPGNVIPDILGARCKVYLGFTGTAWREDYVTIFRGVVTEVSSDAGKVTLQINSPEDKKRSNIFKQVENKLFAAVNSSQTTIPLENAAGFLQKITGPSGAIDPYFKTLIRIDDEIIEYDSISGSDLVSCTRGALGTIQAAHDVGASVVSFYIIGGNCIDTALKLLASGYNGYFREDIPVSELGSVESTPTDNAIYFKLVNLEQKYNIQVGDFVTTIGATNGANNVTLREILDLIETENGGSYIVVDGAPLVAEDVTSATISFRSQYDVWPDGIKLENDEIDFDEHNRVKRLFLSGFDYTIYLKETIDNASEFLETQIYSPVAAYSLPRKSRASVGYHIGPIPGEDIKVLDANYVKNASKTKLVRTTNKNFYNEIVYKWDEDPLEDNRFLSGLITISATSKNQIKTSNKTLTIEAKGLRTVDLGESIATSQSNRRLDRYRFGAELIKVSTTFDVGFALEVGDIVVYDGAELSLPDIKTGAKGMKARLFEVTSKDINIKTGDISLEIVDTNFDGTARYCLISPSSRVASALSANEFYIKESFSGRYGVAEYRKWKQLVGTSIQVRNDDFSLVSDSVLTSVDFNKITVSPALSFTPTVDMVFELTKYNDADVLDKTKLIYGHMKDTIFDDGKPQYQML